MKRCEDCGHLQTKPNVVMCEKCVSVALVEVDTETVEAELQAIELEKQEFAEYLDRASSLPCSTLEAPPGLNISEQIGMVFGNSSKQAFWGLSSQANRLSRAYDAALINLKFDAAKLGADAVVGIRFALNNSQGSGNQLLAGSSEAVMLLGTAVRFRRD